MCDTVHAQGQGLRAILVILALSVLTSSGCAPPHKHCSLDTALREVKAKLETGKVSEARDALEQIDRAIDDIVTILASSSDWAPSEEAGLTPDSEDFDFDTIEIFGTVRESAVMLLTKLRGNEVDEAISNALASEHADVRVAGILVCQDTGRKDMIPELTLFLDDTADPHRESGGLHLLITVDTGWGAERRQAVYSPQVREWALDALQELSGIDVGYVHPGRPGRGKLPDLCRVMRRKVDEVYLYLPHPDEDQ